MTNKLIVIGWLILSLIGFLDATYLIIQYYRGAALECMVLEECDLVTSSRYAVIGGVPIALLGALYYLSVLLLAAAYLDTKHGYIVRIIRYLTFLGFLASLILVYLQVFVVHALCFYCLVSALISTILFIPTVAYLKNFSQQTGESTLEV